MELREVENLKKLEIWSRAQREAARAASPTAETI